MPKTLTAELAIQIFADISEAINAALGRQEILQRTLQIPVERLGYKAASIRMLDPERQTLEVQATVGLSDRYLAKGPVEVTNSPIDREVLQGNPVSIEDIQHDPRWQYPEEAQAEGIRSVLAVPLHINERYWGVLRVYTDELYGFSPAEQQLISAVGNVAARIIRNMRFYQAMHKIAADVNSSLDLDKVLQALLDNVIEQVRCKAAAIRLLDPEKRRLHLVATQGLSEQYLQKGDVLVQDSPIDRQVLQGKVTWIYDVQQEPGFQYPEKAAQEGIRSVLAVPLAVREQIIGVLRIYSAQAHRFNADEVEFLRTVAELGAVAIDNARLYQALNERYEAAREDWAGWYRFLALS